MATPTPTSQLVSTSLSSIAARVSTITPTIVATAGQLYTVSIPAVAPAQSAAAQSILDKGAHLPNAYNAANPVPLFIIQAIIIIGLSKLLAWPLAKLRQPKVISEVIGGIVLGPSIMGRIPGFTKAIFPAPSIPLLSLVANIGLILFLFLVGLEADFSVFKKNAKAAVGISFFGLVIPFGLGAAVSVGIYNKFVDTAEVDFGIFLLFVGTAMAITAFPVLARILTELKMLNNHVGLTVLAAGVGNDVVGWILLALSVALANAGNGVTAVYILLCGVGLCLFLTFIVRPVFVYLVRRSGSYEHGPTAGIMALTLFLALATAFITDIIGIHAIFGSFLVGLIVVPHHHGFAAALTEKMEDLVTILFIPIYFALSGLKTDLGLLNNGSIWGWAIAVIVVAFFGKFLPCAAVAKACKFDWRESLAVGSLMSCKGLVELIVLNIGLQAGILNNEIFAMFVVMALVTTFMTTPLTIWFYPYSYWGTKSDGEGKRREAGDDSQLPASDSRDNQHFRRNFVVVLERLESLPSMMSFIRLLGTGSTGNHVRQQSSGRDSIAKDSVSPEAPVLEKQASTSSSSSSSDDPVTCSPVSVDAYRLLALSERTSDIMKASESEVTKRVDPILNIFTAFANMASVPISTSMSIVPQENFAETVTEHASKRNADMLVIPWAAGTSLNPDEDGPSGNPLEGLFGHQQAIQRSPQYAAFVRRIFVESESDVGLFLDAGVSSIASPTSLGGHNHIFLPFHGGPDDRAALDFVMQLVANNSHITATISRVVKTAEQENEGSDKSGEAEPSSPVTALNQLTVGAGLGAHDTVYAGASTQHRLASDTADNVALARYFPSAMVNSNTDSENIEPPRLPQAVARTTFETLKTSTPLRATLSRMQELNTSSRSVLLVLGRSRRSAPTHRIELESYLKEKVVAGHGGISNLGIAASSDVRKTLGDLGSAAVVSGQASSILILQSAVKGEAYMKSKKGKGV